MTRRIVAITIAIALAALGTVGGLYLVLTADQRAQNKISNPVTVAVATADIPRGTSGAKIRAGQLVRLVKMPKDAVPDDVLSDVGTELDALVTTSAIATGQVLMRANFGSASAVTSGLAVPAGMMAVTVATGAPEQVAGYVQPGSQVTIFLTYHPVGNDGSPSAIQRTKVLLPRVDVLAVGGRGAANNSSLLLTVAVNQADAERLIEGLNHGTLYLGLLTDSVQVSPGSGVDNRQL
jgi:pilus assembly protein CpaB